MHGEKKSDEKAENTNQLSKEVNNVRKENRKSLTGVVSRTNVVFLKGREATKNKGRVRSVV